MLPLLPTNTPRVAVIEWIFLAKQKEDDFSFNSHPVNAPYMAQLIMPIFGHRDRSWGRPSGLTRGMPFVCRRFESSCNDFSFFALASIAEIPT